jgi:hypothetical protein
MRAATTIFAITAVVAGCASRGYRIESAAGDVAPEIVTSTVTSSVPSDADVADAYAYPILPLSDRVRVLDSRATMIDREPTLGFMSIELDVDAFSDVTDEQFARMEKWYDGDHIAKIRMVPGTDRNDTEEFYYDKGRLILVYWNPNGVQAQNTVDDRPAESFYFGQEGLIAWTRDDGTRVDSTSADFKHWDQQLRKEAQRFIDTARRR